jgi:hypothetical protein
MARAKGYSSKGSQLLLLNNQLPDVSNSSRKGMLKWSGINMIDFCSAKSMY